MSFISARPPRDSTTTLETQNAAVSGKRGGQTVEFKMRVLRDSSMDVHFEASGTGHAVAWYRDREGHESEEWEETPWRCRWNTIGA